MNKLQSNTTLMVVLAEDASITQLNNVQVVNFSGAVNKVWYNKSNEKQEKTVWWKVKRFFPSGKTIDIKYLKKGAMVALSGDVEAEGWIKKTGGIEDKKNATAPVVETQLVLNCDDWFITRFAVEKGE